MDYFSACFLVRDIETNEFKYYYCEFEENNCGYPKQEDFNELKELIKNNDDIVNQYDIIDLCGVMDSNGYVVWEDKECWTK